jgi:hypothetical protein
VSDEIPFEGREYVPYIKLMRKLRLEWTWTEGDYFIDDFPERALGGVRFKAAVSQVQIQGRATYGGEEAAGMDSVSLPRLDQWMALLEGEGIDSVHFFRTIAPDGHVVARTAERHGIMVRGGWEAEGRTHEEAAARLWIAVTGRMTAWNQHTPLNERLWALLKPQLQTEHPEWFV